MVLHAAALDSHEIENLRDQPKHMFLIRFDAREGEMLSLRHGTMDSHIDQFGEAANGVQRRPKLVAHAAEELAL